jgi:hypothetical protein
VPRALPIGKDTLATNQIPAPFDRILDRRAESTAPKDDWFGSGLLIIKGYFSNTAMLDQTTLAAAAPTDLL